MRLFRAAACSGAALLVVVLTVAIDAGPAGAQTGTMECTGSGTVQLASGTGSAVSWTVDLTGVSCVSSDETLGGTVGGTGTSDGLGLCPAAPSDPTVPLTVDNLRINATENLSGGLGGVTVNDTWTAPLTTFPITTPFLIERGGSLVGAGTIFTHIYAQCPPAGTPSAFVVWTELAPV
jgi:hypothetical protein